jgi:hypothetical protein
MTKRSEIPVTKLAAYAAAYYRIEPNTTPTEEQFIAAVKRHQEPLTAEEIAKLPVHYPRPGDRRLTLCNRLHLGRDCMPLADVGDVTAITCADCVDVALTAAPLPVGDGLLD